MKQYEEMADEFEGDLFRRAGQKRLLRGVEVAEVEYKPRDCYIAGFLAAREMAVGATKHYCEEQESCGCEAFKCRRDIRQLGEREVEIPHTRERR